MKSKSSHQDGNQQEPTPLHDRSALMEKYVAFKTQYGNLADSTLVEYKLHINQFFDWVDLDNSPERLNQLDFQAIQEFVIEYAKTHNSRGSMHYSLRSFLNFFHIEGYSAIDLSGSVPSVRKRKLTSVPFIIDENNLDQLFKSIDRNDMAGKRDISILEMLSTYGVRGIQVRQLKLDDLFWHQGRILFRPAKGGFAIEQPLIPEVADVLQDYLLNARPKSTEHREVFLTVVRPFKPLTKACLSVMVARRLIGAEIQILDKTHKGSHLFRHTFASRLLNAGNPLPHIAEMLGHRSQNSTLIYTKIDFKKLMNVAQEWPEVFS